MPSQDRRDTIHFSESVAAGATVELTKEMERDATIERIDVRIYRGAEFALEVEPFKHPQPGETARKEPLLQYRGREFVAGDADRFSFPVAREVESGQELGVEVRNTAGSFSYDFNVSIIVEYAEGSNRTVSSLIGGIFN